MRDSAAPEKSRRGVLLVQIATPVHPHHCSREVRPLPQRNTVYCGDVQHQSRHCSGRTSRNYSGGTSRGVCATGVAVVGSPPDSTILIELSTAYTHTHARPPAHRVVATTLPRTPLALTVQD